MASTARPDPDAALLAAIRQAPRRLPLPALPADAEAVRRATPELALAAALEEARRATLVAGACAPTWAASAFADALAAVVRAALAPANGDPTFQALLLRKQSPEVDEFIALQAQLRADQRQVRTQLDHFAHPGKRAGSAGTPHAEKLDELHALGHTGDWARLRAALAAFEASCEQALRAAIDPLTQSPALARLERLQALEAQLPVRRYRALCAARGPVAGSGAAAAQGRASARVGEQAEAASARVFGAMAGLLNLNAAPGTTWRAVRGLRIPAGFPGLTTGAKDEWDLALVAQSDAGARLALLAEVKASPTAAAPDLPRLVSGLRRLARSQPGVNYRFTSDDGPVDLSGLALRELRPLDHALPERVIYCCDAPPEQAPAPLTPASRALLLGEAETLEFARRHAAGGPADPALLLPLWDALATRPRLRPVLLQSETARIVRDALLRPQDLLEALRAQLAWSDEPEQSD